MFIAAHLNILLAVSIVLIAIGLIRWLVVEDKRYISIPIFTLGVTLYLVTAFYVMSHKLH